MKPNPKTIVTGFVVCFAIATGISSSFAQTPGESLLPPTDINTAANKNVVPLIVSGDQAREQSSRKLAPIVTSASMTTPQIKPGRMLTPRIATTAPPVQGSGIQQTTATQQGPYAIQPVYPDPHQSANPRVLRPKFGSPPIVQGSNTSPVIEYQNPGSFGGSVTASEPSYIQASSPLPSFGSYPGFGPQDNNAQSMPKTNLPMESQVQDMSMVPSVVDIMPVESPVMPMHSTLMSQDSNCASCDSGVASPSTIIGRSFLRRRGLMSSSGVGCNNCGDAGCTNCVGNQVSGCSSCGAGGCYDVNDVDKRFAACGFISRARRYFILDVLYMTRANGEVRGINLSPIDDFNYGFGGRLTLGTRSDAANGREFSYFGTFDIEEGGVVADGLGRINRVFIPDGVFVTPANLTAFTNITSASEQLETSFHSFEYNRVRWGWDVVKVLFGARYVNLEDDYDLTTNTLFGETGSLSVDTKNHMVGPQVGLELFYDVGFRWSLSGYGKFGLMLNAYDADVVSSANGFGITNSGTNEADLSYLLDLGLTAHYQLSSRARFRVGYNLLYLGDVATADEAFPRVLSPASATSIDADDDALFSGLSLGLEFYR